MIKLPRSQNYVLGVFIAIFSLYAMVNNEFGIGIPGSVLALAVATTYRHVVIDFATGKKGEFTCFFSKNPLGRWEHLPLINRLVLKRFSEHIKEEISDSGVYQTYKY